MPRRSPPREVRNVRFLDAEWAVIKARAAELDTWPSTYVREVALREARRELASPTDRPAVR